MPSQSHLDFAGAAGLGLSAKVLAAQLADQKPKRVGILGPGWYGKCDLFRLIQVSLVTGKEVFRYTTT
jgi:hypothetical protein